MKKLLVFSAPFLLFALMPLFAWGQAKKAASIYFQPQYKKGEVFRYRAKITTSTYRQNKKIRPTQQLEMIFSYQVLKSYGHEARVAFEIERVRSLNARYRPSSPLQSQLRRSYVRGLSNLEMRVGPHLQTKRIYGLDRFAQPFLDNLPLDADQQSALRHLLRRSQPQVNRMIQRGYMKDLDRLFQNRVQVGKKVKARGDIPGVIGFLLYFNLQDIRTKKGKKVAHFRVRGAGSFSDLYQLMGFRITKFKSDLVVNDRGLTEKNSIEVETIRSSALSKILSDLGIRRSQGSTRVKSQIQLERVSDQPLDIKKAKLDTSRYELRHYQVKGKGGKNQKSLANRVYRAFEERLRRHYGPRKKEIRLFVSGKGKVVVAVPKKLASREGKTLDFLLAKRGELSFHIVSDLYREIRHSFQVDADHLKKLKPSDRKVLKKKISQVLEKKKKGTYKASKEKYDVAFLHYSPGVKKPILLKNTSTEHIDSSRVQSLYMIRGPRNLPALRVTFDSRGKAELAQMTKKNVRRNLAVVLDNKILSVPFIMTPVTGGEAVISGGSKEKGLDKKIFTVLRHPLPAPVKRVK